MSRPLTKIAVLIATAALTIAIPIGAGGASRAETRSSLGSVAVNTATNVNATTEVPQTLDYKIILAGLAAVAFLAVRRRDI